MKTNKMITIIKKLHQEIEKPAVDGTHFVDSLQQYFEQLYNLTAEVSRLYDLPPSALNEILQLSFESRIKLNKKYNDFILNLGKEDDELLARVYDMNRALRYLEDYVLELAMKDIIESGEQQYTTLHGDGPYLMIPAGQKLDSLEDLQSGDVILSRGSAFTSAAIARIGVNDTQFSHLSFVYRNPEEAGKLYTVEAHIEIGSVVEPIEIHIDQKNSRTVVYRFEDGEVAHQAAAYMFQKVKAQSDKGKNIEYNFSMLYKDTNRLFCSQVIYDGFHQATNQTLDVPKFKTQFNLGLVPFLNRLGIPLTKNNIKDLETFSPGDIEYDPRFTLIAEWKAPDQLSDSRLKDAILTKMFYWMDKEDYHIHQPFSVAIKSRITWLLKRIPLLKKVVDKKVPINMTVGQMNLFLTLDKIGKILLEEVLKVQKTKEYPLSMKEVFELLEVFKNEDKQSKNPRFHQWFHQREGAVQ